MAGEFPFNSTIILPAHNHSQKSSKTRLSRRANASLIEEVKLLSYRKSPLENGGLFYKPEFDNLNDYRLAQNQRQVYRRQAVGHRNHHRIGIGQATAIGNGQAKGEHR